MSAEPMIGNMRVWWIPQVPMKAFFVPVESIKEAKKILDVLAQYDLFQLQHNIKPDFSNAGGLEVYEADSGEDVPGWSDWYSEDGYGIDEVNENGDPL